MRMAARIAREEDRGRREGGVRAGVGVTPW